MPLQSPYIDLSAAPVIRVNFSEQVHAAELQAILETFDTFYAENTDPFALIIDCSTARPARTGARKMLTEHETRWRNHKQRLCAAQAFVIADTMIRGVVQAIFWVQPPGYPLKVFENFDEARTWTTQQFRKHKANKLA